MQTYLITPAFCKAQMLRDCFTHLWKTDLGSSLGFRPHRVVVDNHYPVDKKKNQKEIREICRLYGATYVDSKRDLGLHEGLNNAVKTLGITAEDLIIQCDPDDRPDPGGLHALEQVMRADPSFAVLGLSFSVIHRRKREGVSLTQSTVAGHRVWTHPTVEMWNIAAYNMRFIYGAGGFKELFAFYGGLESRLHPEWVRRGMRLGYLPDFSSEAVPVNKFDDRLVDPSYMQWKLDHVTGKFSGKFEDWLIVTLSGGYSTLA